jgi:hypothetical protein
MKVAIILIKYLIKSAFQQYKLYTKTKNTVKVISNSGFKKIRYYHSIAI